jgi:hypothetical protein
MPQIIQCEGQLHEFPDDFTQADIQRALSGLPRSQQLADVPASERRFPLVGDDWSVPAPQSAIPLLPPGYKLDPLSMPLQISPDVPK